jgi:hypothetical protein
MRSLKAFVDYNNPESFASRLRKRRIRYVADLVAETYRRKGSVRLDLGTLHLNEEFVSPC